MGSSKDFSSKSRGFHHFFFLMARMEKLELFAFTSMMILSLSRSSAEFTGPVPSKVVMNMNLGYDNSLLEHFGNSHEKAKTSLVKVVELATTMKTHDSLLLFHDIMKIDIKIGKISHINETITIRKTYNNGITH